MRGPDGVAFVRLRRGPSPDLCPDCQGTGWVSRRYNPMRRNRGGWLVADDARPPERLIERECERCNGSGRIPVPPTPPPEPTL